MTKRRTTNALKIAKASRTAHTGASLTQGKRTRKVGNDTTTPNKALEKKALNRAIDEALDKDDELDKDAAWDLFRKIRDHEGGFRKLIYRFDVGQGWKALGDKSLRECFRKRCASAFCAH
jgi:hypothetical protein